MNQRKPYPSDRSDARRALIEPTLTVWRKARLDRRPTGQPAKVDLRDVFSAILYVNRTGIPWKYLPHDFPNHGTVYAMPRRRSSAGSVASSPTRSASSSP
ncbi:transposase [Streptomyces sp. CA-251387]|uniref:transposase n=1 Tax=Streptomyces sp. CA-251387 TaxID=3240064 RepID=UPI003D93B93A